MKNGLKIISILLFLASCNAIDKKNKDSNIQTLNKEKDTTEEIINIEELLTHKVEDTSIVFKIKENCVFFTQLTTKESDSIEKIDAELYSILSEELNNNANNALDLLSKLKIKNYWSDKRYVSFKTKEKEYFIDTRKKDIKTHCILFIQNKKPEIVSIEPLEEDSILKYFKK